MFNVLKFLGSRHSQNVNPFPHSTLIDVGTNAVLTTSPHISAIVFLAEITQDSLHVTGTNYPHYTSSFFLDTEPTENYPRWTWEWKTRSFIPTREDVLTQTLFDKSKLAMAKLSAIVHIVRGLNVARYPVHSGIEYQSSVYADKKAEAEAFVKSEYDESDLTVFPYLLQYADFAGISMRQATDDILLKAKMDRDILLKTEFLRLKFSNLVRHEQDASKVPDIVEAFKLDHYITAKL